MAALSLIRYLIFFTSLLFYFKSIAAESKSSFYFKNFSKDSNFDTQVSVYGDSKVVNDGLSLKMNGSSGSGVGRIIYKKPIKLVDRKTKDLVSFSTNFSFSMSLDDANGLAFFMVPISFPLNASYGGSFGLLAKRKVGFFSVEFDISKDKKNGDPNGNNVGRLISVKVSDVSSVNNLVLNSGNKLQAWIDYEVSSKRLEIRLSKLGQMRPVDPFLSYSIDMSLMWKEDEVFSGLSSLSGNSSQFCNVYSWSFNSRQAPHLMHSQPLDPVQYVEERKSPVVHKRSNCFIRILAALIFGIACGALGAFFLLVALTIFGENGRPIVPEEYAVQPVKIQYEKFEVAVEKPIEDGKK